jgi:hypothetical protein
MRKTVFRETFRTPILSKKPVFAHFAKTDNFSQNHNMLYICIKILTTFCEIRVDRMCSVIYNNSCTTVGLGHAQILDLKGENYA